MTAQLDSERPALPAAVMARLGRSLLIDRPIEGGAIWASGRTWKGSFGSDGFTYIPFLGSDAPRNFPVQFALESVTVDGAPLDFESHAAVSRDGRTITLDRGSVREVYHVDGESVEQTFVFDSLPRSGDVAIRMRVESELARVEDGAGFTFVGDRGGVRYGAATGVAASGARMPLQERFVEGSLEIRVPAQELSADAFPFVVDPILSTINVTGDTRDQIDVDVAFDGNSGVYMIAYEEVQSADDHDIRSVYYNTNVDLFLNEAAIDISSDSWEEPSVANGVFDSHFLCVASRSVGIATAAIWGRVRNASNGFNGPAFEISNGLLGDNTSPDVGGNGGDFNTQYPFMVVWQNRWIPTNDYDIYGQAVDIDGSLSGARLEIATDPSIDDTAPSISKSSGERNQLSPEHEYLVAWEREVNAIDHDIWTRVVGYAGQLAAHDEWRSYSFGDSRRVDVSSQTTANFTGSDPVYVLAFERFLNGSYKIFTVATREGNADNARNLGLMQDLAQDSPHADPRIAYDGTSDILIAYRSTAPSGGYDAHVAAVNLVHDAGEIRTGVSTRRDTLTVPGAPAGALAIASTNDGGSLNDDSTALVLFTAEGPGGDDEVSGAFVADTAPKVVGAQYCQANENASGTSAWIRATGGNSLPGYNVTIRVQDLPESSFGYVIASLNSGFTANPGGSAGNLCLTGAIGRFTNQIVNSGLGGAVDVVIDTDAIPQPTGITSAVSGDSWHFQYWTRDSQDGMPTSNFSNAVEVSFR
ncbi:MAG: hypothetical protein AAF726_13715 [Planctomycetota bacterium]